MARTNEDAVIHASVVPGLILGGLTWWLTGVWWLVLGAFLSSVFIIGKFCPYCKQLIFRDAPKCSECTADLK